MADVQFTQGRVVSVDSGDNNAQVSQARLVSVDSGDNNAQVSQVGAMAVVVGRVADTKIRAWNFVLDGHEFYVLRLGDQKTLVFDLSTGQWHNWGTGITEKWNISQGINWLGGNSLASEYGSNVLVGSDYDGVLFILNPYAVLDEDVNGTEGTFERTVQGQLILRGYDRVPCFGVQLYGDIGKAWEAGDWTVKLETSDDLGNFYYDHGSITMDKDNYEQRIEWRSLGSMKAPGRLFRITDYGAFQRLDGLELIEPNG